MRLFGKIVLFSLLSSSPCFATLGEIAILPPLALADMNNLPHQGTPGTGNQTAPEIGNPTGSASENQTISIQRDATLVLTQRYHAELLEFLRDEQHTARAYLYLSNSDVTELDLSYNELSVEVIRFIADNFPNLISLNLENILITDIEKKKEIICELFKLILEGKLSNLTTLNLSSNFLGSEGDWLEQLADAVAFLKNLTSLNLEDNNLGAVGFNTLVVNQASFSRITVLHLGRNGWGDREFSSIPHFMKVVPHSCRGVL